jgi:hypothetical protein
MRDDGRDRPRGNRVRRGKCPSSGIEKLARVTQGKRTLPARNFLREYIEYHPVNRSFGGESSGFTGVLVLDNMAVKKQDRASSRQRS